MPFTFALPSNEGRESGTRLALQRDEVFMEYPLVKATIIEAFAGQVFPQRKKGSHAYTPIT
jgi:hypothetical protein